VGKGNKRHIVSAWVCFSTYLHQRQILPREHLGAPCRSTSKNDIIVNNRHNIQSDLSRTFAKHNSGWSEFAGNSVYCTIRRLVLKKVFRESRFEFGFWFETASHQK